MLTKDYHIHSEFSGDSSQPLEELIIHSIALGLKEIAITDHSEFGVPNLPERFILDYPKYVARIESLREQYKKDIQIRLGLEVGMYAKVADYFKEQIAAHPFDFIIGSNHSVGNSDISKGLSRTGKPKEEIQRLYFECLWNNIQTFDDYSVIGHLDYVTRYGPEELRGLNLTTNWDHIQTILKHLVARGKGIEINTSGFRYGEGRFYPLPEIVQEYIRLGGEIITLGSDAHKKEDIARDFVLVEDFLRSIDFPYLASFEKRKPIIEKI